MFIVQATGVLKGGEKEYATLATFLSIWTLGAAMYPLQAAE